MTYKEAIRRIENYIEIHGRKEPNAFYIQEALIIALDLMKKKEKGVLKEAPCKLGEWVYIPWVYDGTNGIAFFEVTFIVFDNQKPYIKTDFETDDDGFFEMLNGGVFYFDDFGKTVFLTEEEAAQKLEEMGGRNGL